MRKLFALVLIVSMGLLPVVSSAASKSKTRKLLTLVLGATTAETGAPVSMEITAAVIEQLSRSGRVDIVTYSPELPIIARAVMEKRLSKEAADSFWEPKNAIEIAKVMKAEYALCMKGSTTADKVNVTLELQKVPSGGNWKTNAESEIVTGPRSGTVRSNAISTAASSAVSQLLLDAFGDSELLLPEKPKPAPTAQAPVAKEPASAKPEPAKSQATEQPEKPAQPEPEPQRDVAAEYNTTMRQAEVYISKRDMRNAALELRRAINLDPGTPSARVKLAEVYSDLGMTDAAMDECRRALLFVKDNAAIHNMLTKLYLSSGHFAEAADQCRELIRLDPTNIEARIALGDICWNQAKVDDALAAYQEAIKVDAKNETAHGRLQKLYAARKKYPEALQHLLAVRVPTADAEPDASKRYVVLANVIEDEFGAVLGKIEAARKDFGQGRIAREDYYQDCKDAASRIDALATYLSTQTAPSAFREASTHGVLAISLLSQSGGYMVSFLETEKVHYRDQAVLLENEAKTEMSLFAKAVGGA